MTSKRRTATEEIIGRIELLQKQSESWKQDAAACRRQAEQADAEAVRAELLVAEYSALISHPES